MSVQEAHRFIIRAESDAALQERVRRLPPDPDRDDLVRLGASEGFIFDARELAEAYRLDARMRAASGGVEDQSGSRSRT
jgi:predicted ribosomally synthesized peptide with nif11-like leader